MTQLSHRVRLVVALVVLACCAAARAAVPPLETLLPNTTKGFFLTPSMDQLREKFNKCQLGQMFQDESMKPFVDDLRRQLQEKWTKTYYKLGVNWEDMREVPSGEAALAFILMSPEETSTVVLADVKGQQKQTNALLDKINKNMVVRKARQRSRPAQGATMTVFDIPKHDDQPARQTVYFVKDDLLAITDNLKVAEGILARQAAPKADSLAKLKAFEAVMARSRKIADEQVPNIRWFVEPFGFADALKLANDKPRKKKKGTDMLKALKEQGFTAIQGVGGFVNFSIGEFDVLDRTFMYAPGSPKPAERFTLAARMLDFPNGGTFGPPAWVPRDVATFATFNFKTRPGFEYSKTLVDAIAADEVFDDVLDSLKTDENGPRVDIRRDVIGNLANRLTIVSDIKQPITPDSEHMLIAAEATDEGRLHAAVKKWMEADPDIRRRVVNGYEVWEVVEPEDAAIATTEKAKPGGSSKDKSGGKNDKGSGKPADKKAADKKATEKKAADKKGAEKKGTEKKNADKKSTDKKDKAKPADEDEEEKEERILTPGSAITVAHGQLFVATHIDILARVLARIEAHDTLNNSADYRRLQADLGKVALPEQLGQMFTRTDESWRQTFELFRVGKLPQAQSFVGKLLNAFLGDDKDEVREPRLDGSKLPNFDTVRRYLGPAGMTYTTEADGWMLTGIMLNKDGQ